MAERHGIYIQQNPTELSVPILASVGIPFVIGASPIHQAETPAEVDVPQVITSFKEFTERFGYSEDWDSYPLCEFAYSHFRLYGLQPVIFCNVLDSSTAKQAVPAADMAVSSMAAELPESAILSSIVVKQAGGSGEPYTAGVDYTSLYEDGKCLVMLLADSEHASETQINIAYDKVTPSAVTPSVVAGKMDSIDLCASETGYVPDLIAAPGYSQDVNLAALMDMKAGALNGVFSAKAVVDIDTTEVTSYSVVSAYKKANLLASKNTILCYPMAKLGDRKFHLSTQLCGAMATVDAGNGGIPYESPSNKALKINSLCLEDGSVVRQTKEQADVVNAAGVVTAYNSLALGWVAWGNYTAAYPGTADVKDKFIPISRMFDFVGNTFVKTFWSKLDAPLNARLLHTIVDSTNVWLNGLQAREYLYGARCAVFEDENPISDLMNGIIRVHIFMTPPAPAQEIDAMLEYDVGYLTALYAA